MISVEFKTLFEALEQFPGLQSARWDLNQTGTDRAMEAVLVQRASRELATFVLCQIRLACMPELASNESAASENITALLGWARTQGAGGTALSNLLSNRDSAAQARIRQLAALATLRYYHCREDWNPVVKVPWTAAGLDGLRGRQLESFAHRPAGGAFWERKLRVLEQLMEHMYRPETLKLNDERLVARLEGVDGVGPQTAAMVALFWAERPVPVLDEYLLRLLKKNDLLPNGFRLSSITSVALARYLVDGAHHVASSRPNLPAHRVLACLYLWACEVGRRFPDSALHLQPVR